MGAPKIDSSEGVTCSYGEICLNPIDALRPTTLTMADTISQRTGVCSHCRSKGRRSRKKDVEKKPPLNAVTPGLSLTEEDKPALPPLPPQPAEVEASDAYSKLLKDGLKASRIGYKPPAAPVAKIPEAKKHDEVKPTPAPVELIKEVNSDVVNEEVKPDVSQEPKLATDGLHPLDVILASSNQTRSRLGLGITEGAKGALDLVSSVTDIGGLLSIGLMYAIVPRFRRKGLLGLTLGFASHKTRVLLRRGMRGIAARMKVVPAVGLALSAASFVFAFSVSTYPLALGLSVTGLSLAVGWPVYRGLRAAINRRPLRGQSFDVERYGINGKRSVLDMLKRSVRSDKDDVLRDAFKNPIWTENRHLPDAERHGVYKRFEETVTLSLRELNLDAMHYGVANARAFGHKGSGDGGIDVLVPAGKTPKMIIQCKCYGDVVSISDVKALHSTVSSKAHAGALGVLVTTKGFTEDARRFAKENNIGLTTLDELIKLSR